jgi:hypothetical protein
MPKVIILLLLIAANALAAPAQSQSQSAIDKLPTVTTQGDTNPEAVSDINAQLIWSLAASPAPQDTSVETAARSEYQSVAFGRLNVQNQEKLNATLRDFRSRHDAFAADYNAAVPSVSRNDVWEVYRDFRIKVNDLVAETVRALNDQFPDSAAQFQSVIQTCKATMALSAYRSSSDPNYASNPRTAATGFTYIQGAVTNGAYTTAVIVGMVPGCPGRVYPQVAIGGSDASVDGPHIHPWQYMHFQQTGRVNRPQTGYVIAVECAIGSSQ